MSDAEIAAFLDAAHTLHVASINSDGTPHLVPMWFLRDGDTVQFWTYAKSQKVVNLQRDPRCTVMAEAGLAYGDLHGVSISGRAEIIEDRARVMEFGNAMGAKYFSEDADAVDLEAMGAKRVLVVIHPERVTSWDHRKI
jgi:PPOX class probable F420-dependent enzyme